MEGINEKTHTEQTKVQTKDEIQENDWIKQELEEFAKNGFDGERLPTFKLEEENKEYLIKIDFSKPFDKKPDKFNDGVIKKLIPLEYEGTKYIWWLNVYNPCYKAILDAYVEIKQTEFRLMRNGSQADTKYIILK